MTRKTLAIVLAGQWGFQGITGLYWAAVLASKRARPWVLKFGGRAHRARGSSTTVAKFRRRPERHRPPETASYGGTDMDRGRCAILKMVPQITITNLRLVDTIVLEGMGLPTAGLDSPSKSPTDPTALAVRQ